MIDFLWPLAALALPLPFLVYWVVPKADRQEPALQVPFFRVAASFTESGNNKQGRSFFRRLIMLLMWSGLVLAATRPQWIGEPISLPTSGRDLLLAVDISGSMGAEDMRKNGVQSTRLSVVKEVVGDFVERRKGDRLGLILFGTRAYLQV